MGVEHATPGIAVVLLLTLLTVLYYIRTAREGKRPLSVRRIPGIQAIDEAVGRSVELGRPISFTTGLTGLGPVLYACLGVLYYIGKKAALYKARLISPQTAPEVLAVSESTLRDAYRAAGRSHLFDPQSLVFLSEEQFAFASGYMGLIHREQAGSAFLFGGFTAESLILAEAGQQIGAMQVAASMSPEQVAFFICTCDYTLIGEELFAASAYLTKEPVQMGSLFGQDRAKLIFLLLIVVGVGIATWNSVFPDRMLPNVEQLLTAKAGWE